ncbi:MAG: hybrid sensor histidine kinase/response regulator, partial [Alphaproteobacteria bacterium]|nr:hybrid sensor histidine kinase/response regulator [Alphaproteobacteria bacterium]
MSQGAPAAALEALILAPRGRDSSLARTLLGQAGIPSTICRTTAELAKLLRDDTGFVLLTEEAIRGADLRPLVTWISAQPAWSDLPFVLVTDHGGGPERNPIAARWL